jgi:arylsulfatase A-like enzyme
LQALDRLKLTGKTLVIFTSDNGPVVDDGYRDLAVPLLGDHSPAGPWRGGKYSAFEGGTRVPTITRWPGHVKVGVSGAVVGQVDLLRSLAVLVGETLGEEDGPDSFNVLPALFGDSRTGRVHLVQQSGVLSLRQGTWKVIEAGRGPARFAATNIESGRSPRPQLYDLQADPGETANLAEADPDRLQAMLARLGAIREAGHSRP